MNSSRDRQRLERIDSILDEALDLPKDQRTAFLEERCGDDHDLRIEIEKLLIAATEEGGPLDRPVADLAQRLIASNMETRADKGPGSSPGADDLEIPSAFGPYQILERLGSGGMGVVYEGWDTRLERPVAIKILPSRLLHVDAKARFLREARTASALDHANICTVHDIGESDDGRLFIVMALYRGETLQERLSRGPVAVEEARDLTVQIASGLERAHQAGIVHRDIKPANILITEHGEVKILDFGIAKIADDLELTRTGIAVGTPAYMAPEQALGETVDGRADIWALGVVLHEMVAGKRPFAGDTPGSMLRAVLQGDRPTLDGLRGTVPESLLRVIERALASDPAARYPSAAELIDDLGSGATVGTAVLRPSASRLPRSLSRLLPWAIGIVAAVFLLSWFWISSSPDPPAVAPSVGNVQAASTSGEPLGMLVLHFQNLRGNPELDWLSQGITEMLVTGLRQSPDLNVLSSRGLYAALEDLDLLEEPTLSPAEIERVAERTGRHLVLHGSFVSGTDQCRIAYNLDDVRTGEVLIGGQVLAPLTEDCFLDLVDKLSYEVRERLLASDGEGRPSVRDYAISIEAWKRYSEGLLLSNQSKTEEAIERLEEAVEIEPTFALALHALGILHGNLDHHTRQAEYSRRALELADRLPPKLRLTVQAAHYDSHWSTLDRAIAVYEEGLALYPNITPWRDNLGYAYASHERFEEALSQFEFSIAKGSTWPGTYANAAQVHAVMGQYERGLEVLVEIAGERPDDWKLQRGLGELMLYQGRVAEADAYLERSYSLLGSPNRLLLIAIWQQRVLSGADTARVIDELCALDEIVDRGTCALVRAHMALLDGGASRAVAYLEEAMELEDPPGEATALLGCWLAEILLGLERPEDALDAAGRAIQYGVGTWSELWARFLVTRAWLSLDNGAAAAEQLAWLEARFEERPNRVEERQIHHLRGVLAWRHGDLDLAISELERAEAMLSPGTFVFEVPAARHVPIRFDLARALLEADRAEDAARMLEKVRAAGVERLNYPLEWRRGAFLLGRLHHEAGDVDAARDNFAPFVAAWKDGELDRPEVEFAASVLLAAP